MDVSVGTQYWIHGHWNVNASVQYEQWKFPLLAAGPQTTIVSSVGIMFAPVGGRVW